MMPRVVTGPCVALVLVIAACGPSLIGSDGGSTGEAETSATITTSVSATTDDGPLTTQGTHNSTSPDPTTVATSTTDTATTATTEGEDDVVDDDANDDDSCLFIACPDGDGYIECDIWAQDCPVFEKCMPWANDGGGRWNATRCSLVDATPGGLGDPCQVEGTAYSGIDDCDLGMMCWNVDPDTNEGTCVALCSGSEADPHCDDAATQCMLEYEGVVPICIAPCDPRLQDCIATSACVPSNDTFFCVPDQSGIEGQTADGCIEFDACDPGLFCADAELVPECADGACCTEFCDLALPDPNTQCTANELGAECIPWYERGQAPAGYELVGACVLPS